MNITTAAPTAPLPPDPSDLRRGSETNSKVAELRFRRGSGANATRSMVQLTAAEHLGAREGYATLASAVSGMKLHTQMYWPAAAVLIDDDGRYYGYGVRAQDLSAGAEPRREQLFLDRFGLSGQQPVARDVQIGVEHTGLAAIVDGDQLFTPNTGR